MSVPEPHPGRDTMRWGLRYQLLTPPLLLLLGVVAITTWSAVASAGLAWQKLETRARNAAKTISTAPFPHNLQVLQWVKGYSGAEYILVGPRGEQVSTFPAPVRELPPAETVADDWQTLTLAGRVTVDDEEYLC